MEVRVLGPELGLDYFSRAFVQIFVNQHFGFFPFVLVDICEQHLASVALLPLVVAIQSAVADTRAPGTVDVHVGNNNRGPPLLPREPPRQWPPRSSE